MLRLASARRRAARAHTHTTGWTAVALLALTGVVLTTLALLAPAAQAQAEGTVPTCDGLEATVYDPQGRPRALTGTNGPDVIVGSIGRDTIGGAGGDDVICGVDGKDDILGGTGTDRIYAGEGDDTVESGAGTGDQVWGGPGSDLITIESSNSAAFGEEGPDTLYSLGDVVMLWGGTEPDRIEGSTGSESVDGGPGNDRISTGPGNDGTAAGVDGGPGNDGIGGGEGNDLLLGGDGKDDILGGKGKDTVRGGTGNDTLEGGASRDVMYGEAGLDHLDSDVGNGDVLHGGTERDTVYSIAKNATLNGDEGDDVLNASQPGATMNGGAGEDKLQGSPFDDTMNGGTEADVLLGDGGDDAGFGDDGDDLIKGGKGNDDLNGDQGTDEVRTGPGRRGDVARGGTGDDDVIAESPSARVYGDEGDDFLYTDFEDVVMRGGDDDDRLGGAGNDVADEMWGEGGVDTLIGASGADELHGGEDGDVIKAGAGNDRAFGEEGNDRCDGEGGRDVCDGGVPGGQANTPTDPDICKAETKRSCKGGAGAMSGTAQGTATVVGGNALVGVQESWDATFSMEEIDGGEGFYEGDASIDVTVSGTDEEGCTYNGAGTVDGTAEMSLWPDDDPDSSYYSVQLLTRAGGPDSFEVQVVCDDGSHTENWVPLQMTDWARTPSFLSGQAPYYEEGMTEFEGDYAYRSVRSDYDINVDWSWAITRG